jgi:hypothetical protein
MCLLTVLFFQGMQLQSALSITSGDLQLIGALPPLVARTLYDSAVKCHLAM